MLKQWIRFLQDYFSVSEREARGFVVVMALMMLLIIAHTMYSNWQPDIPKGIQVKLIALQSDSGALAIPDIATSYKTQKAYKSKNKEVEVTINPFAFDPNTINYDSLCLLGCKPVIARRILSYREKGGKFRQPFDLYRIYGVDSQWVYQIASFVTIQTRAATPKIETAAPTVETLNINEADSSQWVTLKGIGPKLAARICKYRKALGGFVSVQQLAEVYGIDTVVFAGIRSKCIVAPDFKPIQISLAAAENGALKTHPYFGYKALKVLSAYQNTHGPITSVQDLQKIQAFTSDEVKRMLPYIKFEH